MVTPADIPPPKYVGINPTFKMVFLGAVILTVMFFLVSASISVFGPDTKNVDRTVQVGIARLNVWMVSERVLLLQASFNPYRR